MYQYPQNAEAGPSTPSDEAGHAATSWHGAGVPLPAGQIHSVPSTPGVPPTPAQPAPAAPAQPEATSVAIALADRPYLSPAYRDLVVERVLLGMMNAEGRAVDVLKWVLRWGSALTSVRSGATLRWQTRFCRG